MFSNASAFHLKDKKLFSEGDRYSYHSRSKHFTQINRQELVVIRFSLSEKANLHTWLVADNITKLVLNGMKIGSVTVLPLTTLFYEHVLAVFKAILPLYDFPVFYNLWKLINRYFMWTVNHTHPTPLHNEIKDTLYVRHMHMVTKVRRNCAAQ